MPTLAVTLLAFTFATLNVNCRGMPAATANTATTTVSTATWLS